MKDLVKTWADFWAEAKVLSQKLPKPSGQTTLLLQSNAIDQGLLLLLAGLYLGLDIHLDDKAAITDPDSSYLLSPEGLFERGDGHSLFQLQASGDVPDDLRESLRGRRFIFSTSGSTASSKAVVKHSEGLLNEVHALRELFDLQPGSEIVSLVRPFHIYGFLHSFLLPLTLGSPVSYLSTQRLLPSLEAGFPKRTDLMVIVPAHWNLLTYIWTFAYTRTLVSSGSAFGRERSRNLKNFRDHFQNAFEILGSTETGGMGYRGLEEEDESFTLFRGVRLEPVADGTRVFSPFLAPDTSAVTGDQLAMQDQTSFVHRGRTDRVFKYAGQRYSLGELENTLKSVCGGSEVRAQFREDLRSAQGGHVMAWVEVEGPVDLSELRQRFLKESRCPFPQQVFFIKAFPRDAQGKIALSDLEKLGEG